MHFPLLQDPEGAPTARAFVGVDKSGLSVPGIVILDRKGDIVFEQRGEGMRDRLYVADLLKILDDLFGKPQAETELRGGFAPIERISYRAGAGAARASGGDWTFHTDLGALFPISRYLQLGLLADFFATPAADLSGAVQLRLPVDENIVPYLLVPVGVRYQDAWTWSASTHLGAIVYGSPAGALFAEVAAQRAPIADGVAWHSWFSIGLAWLP
jgi:hypothetical protein